MKSERNISVSESTLKYCRDFTFREKLDTVRLIGRLGADTIEFGPLPGNDKSASLLCRTAGALLDDCILSVEVTDRASVDEAVAALASAKKKRLAVSLPLSTVQCEYSYHKKPAQFPEIISGLVSYAAEKCGDVEFRALDATRAEKDIILKSVAAAAEAGAKTITLCDTAGEILPDEFASLVKDVCGFAGDGICIGAECSDRLGLSVACALAAVNAGAGKISCSVCPGAVPVKLFCDALAARGKDIGVRTSIDTTLLGHTAERIMQGFREENGATPFENGVADYSGDAGVPAGADIAAVSAAVTKIGYQLSDEDIIRVYDRFTDIAEKSGKAAISARELDAIVAAVAMQVPPTYILDAYVINSGNTISSTAHITMTRDGKKLTGFCVGDGPIDAAFLAIEQIIGHHYELDDFQIQAVTEGREAMGDALVRLRSDGRLYSGKGLSTDIIGASIRAYISALNKIAHEERDS